MTSTAPSVIVIKGLMDNTSPTNAAVEDIRPPFLRFSSVSNIAIILTLLEASSSLVYISSISRPSSASLLAYSASNPCEIQNCLLSNILTRLSNSPAAKVAL